MEGPAPRSSSHSRAAPPHSSSASAAAAFFKKVDTNGVTAGGNAFMAHDDVYGGPPKYAVTPFAPSGEQYSEIFGSFRSGKACSIPNLDLPPFDDSAAAFDFIGFSGFVYSEIFGGFDFADFALSCDKLFRRSGGSEESSDDAWTEAGSLSEESDPSACSGKTQYQTTDNMLNGSYNKFNMLTTEDSIVIHVAQPSTAPGSGSMYERSSLQKEVEERYDSGLADGIILHKHSSEISVKTHSKTASILSSVSDLKNSEKMYEDSAIDEEPKMDKGALHAELKSTEQDIYGPRHLNVESECSTSPIRPYTLNGTNNIVPETTCECEDLNSSNLVLRLDEKNKKPTAMAIEFDKMLKDHAAEVMLVDVEFRSAILLGEMESNMPQMEHICMSTKHLQNTATQCVMTGRESDCQNQSLSLNINRRVGMEVINVNGNLALDDVENVGNVRKREEFERETRKLQEERKQEWEEKLKLQLKRLEELRAGERDKELDKVCLRKHEQERGGGRENKLEKEFRLWKLDKDWEREREREKDKMGVELNTAAGNERASTETHEMAGRAATERATAEARQKAMAEARERLEKACAEARDKSLSEKASTESWLRAERAAVARATAEARERAFEKAMAERDTFEARELVARSASETFSSPLRDIGLRHTSSYSDLWKSDKTNEVEGETQRGRARLERHCRTVERVAKALAEKNTRDLVAQREQAERNRLAQFLDADIKKWSDGKEGNLHALLSTLQYILGPDSGWHPIPLTELTASASVKKAYRKATLCVHPDKLQQRGATIQQKYICEKVFDLLKDSWSRFNSEER